MDFYMKTVAYLRVSTVEQDLEKDKVNVLKLAHEKKLGHVEFHSEKVTSKVHWEKRLVGKIMKGLKKGDNIITPELTRLGRNMYELMEILSICMRTGINIYAVRNNWELKDNIQSKISAMAFAIAGELEKEWISTRTKDALAAIKASGVKLGRPKGPGKSKLDQFKPEIAALLANGSTQKFIAKRYNTTEANLHRWLKRYNLLKRQ